MLKRLDIQIARTIAVLAVVGFHLGIPGFFNGFLGVDAFFVISGFLMGLLYTDTKPSIFYRKRFTRLYPSLIATVGPFVVFGALILQPFELNQLASQALAGVTGFANVAYWSQDSYFQPDRFRPFLNLWSLGVEIQFYLIFPTVLYLSKKIKLILPILAILSFSLNILILNISPKTSFFLLPTRLWEFIAGVLIADYEKLGKFKKKNFGLVTSAILFLLAVTIPIDSNSTKWVDGHPGLNSLLIVLATSIFLQKAISSDKLKGKFSKTASRIGDFSYEIYLIHFPFLAFLNYRAFTGTNTHLSQKWIATFSIVAIFTFSYAIYRLSRIQVLRKTKHVLSSTLIFSLFLLFLQYSHVSLKRESRLSQLPSVAISDRADYRCGKIFRVLHPMSELCLISGKSRPNKPNLLLFGNSHADMIKNEVVSVSRGRANIYFWVQNSPFQLSPKEIARVLNKFRIEGVLIHSSTSNPEAYQLRNILSQSKSIDFVMLGSIPTYSVNVPKIVHSKLTDKVTDFSKLSLRKYLVPESLQADSYYDSVHASNFSYISTLGYLCKGAICVWHDSRNRIYYFDTDHLTLTGAKALRVPISLGLRKLLPNTS